MSTLGKPSCGWPLIKQFWNCCYFIRFFLCFQLSKNHIHFRSPSTNHMNCRLAISFIMGTPQCFTINRNDFSFYQICYYFDPAYKGCSKFIWINENKYSSYCIMRRNSIGKFQKC